MTQFTFTDRETYLKWVEEWKDRYKELSREIREIKSGRKEFQWSYRPKGDTAMKRKTKIGPNPNYLGRGSTEEVFTLPKLRQEAYDMMIERLQAKLKSTKMREEALRVADAA